MMLTVLCLSRMISLALAALPTAWPNSIHSVVSIQAPTQPARQERTQNATARYVLVAS
jgi:hypothetical protein